MGNEFDPKATEFRRDWGRYRFVRHGCLLLNPRRSGCEHVLHLLCRTKTELARRCDRNGLACARIATLTRRTLFNLELAKARKADLFAFLGGLDNAGTNR